MKNIIHVWKWERAHNSIWVSIVRFSWHFNLFWYRDFLYKRANRRHIKMLRMVDKYGKFYHHIQESVRKQLEEYDK